MAETLLEYEEGVIILRNTHSDSRNQNSVSILEEGDENDYSQVAWARTSDLRYGMSQRIPYDSDYITDYSSYYITEAFELIAEGEGDISDISFDDMDNYLESTGNRLGDFESVDCLAHYTADWMVANTFDDSRNEIMQYYAYCYYENNYGDYIPNLLVSEIEGLDYYGMGRVDDVDDFINDWMTDHEGIEEFMPE